MNVKELMTSPAVSCRPSDPLHTVAGAMWERDIGALPVIDAMRKVVGMITDRDICMAAYTQGRELAEIEVSQVMSREAYTCLPTDSPSDAERIMREQEIRRLPVVDDERRLVGMLSMNDLVREVKREIPLRQKDVPVAELVATMAAIGSPRQHAIRPS